MPSASELLLERVRAATEDEYTIAGELGRGGMAAVYLARDMALERRVAIKVMLPDLIDVEGIEERFVIEAKTAAHLDHPGIVTIYSVKQREGLLFIVMKYIEGRTLDSILKDGQALDHAVITSIVSQVAEALHFAHGEGIIHRDVKPSNIIIDTRGRPVVTDFGIAKITSSKSITVTGSMLGTPAYMSPEQCRGLPATAASDQYSLGVMLYEMLARGLPFEGTIFELIHAHCDEPPPPLVERIADLDPMLEGLVMGMLAKNPRERWASLAEVARLLTEVPVDRQHSVDLRSTIAALARVPEAGTATSPRRRVGTTDTVASEVATTPAPQLVVTPVDPTIEIGESIQMRVSESSGASLQGVRIIWKSEDPTIATIDAKGVLTGRSAGLAKITATAGASFGRVAVNVKSARVDTLVVTPQSPELVAGDEIPFVATVLDARGHTLGGQQLVWTSSDVKVCAVSQQGRAIGVSPGFATITAQSGDAQGAAHVRVKLPTVERVLVDPGDISVEVDETFTLTATPVGTLDRKLADRQITWRSTIPGVATVSDEGVVRGVAPGTAAIFATCEGREHFASVSVRPQPVVSVRIQPARLQLEIGRSLQLSGVGEDRRGRPVSGRSIEWHSNNDTVAVVDTSGKVHGVSEGRAHVQAVSGDITSAIEVTVVARPVARLTIAAHPAALAIGDTLLLEAIALDQEGAALPDRAVVWSSSNPAVIDVDNVGVCEAKGAGSVRITATSGQIRATTKLSARASVATQAIVDPADPESLRPTPVIAPVSTPGIPAPATTRSSKRLWLTGVGAAIVIAAIAVAMKGTGSPPETAVTPQSNPDSGRAMATGVDSSSISRPPTAGSTTSVGGAGGVGPAGSGQPPTTAPQTVAGRVSDRGRTGAAPGPARGLDSSKIGRAGQTPVVNPLAGAQPQPTGGATAADPSGGRGAIPRPRPDSVTPPPGSGAAGGGTGTAAAGAGGAALPNPPTGSAAAPPTAGRGAVDSAAVARAALCTSTTLPANLLTEALGSDPIARITALYQPRDAADEKAKASMLKELKEFQQLRPSVQTVRSESAGDTCDWVMTLDFSYRNFVGASRRRSWQVRLRLENAAAPRIRSIFGATG